MTPSQKFRDFCVKCDQHKAVRMKAQGNHPIEHFCISQTDKDSPLQIIYIEDMEIKYDSTEYYNKTLEKNGIGMVGCPYLLEFMMKEENDTL